MTHQKHYHGHLWDCYHSNFYHIVQEYQLGGILKWLTMLNMLVCKSISKQNMNPQAHSLRKPRYIWFWVDERIHDELLCYFIHQFSTPIWSIWWTTTRSKTHACSYNKITSNLLNSINKFCIEHKPNATREFEIPPTTTFTPNPNESSMKLYDLF